MIETLAIQYLEEIAALEEAEIYSGDEMVGIY